MTQMPAGAAFRFCNRVKVIARDKNGKIKWVEEGANLVTNAGLDDVLGKYLKGSAYTAAFYVGLIDGTPTIAAGDTMSSHAGWSEVTAYSESNRQTLTLGSVASQSVDNSASTAVITCNADSTVFGGAFLVTNNTKGGTTGVLFAALAFSANRTLNNGETLEITWTLTAASA